MLVNSSIRKIEKKGVFMMGLGMSELLIILVIVLLFFGGSKLPELGKAMGKSIGSFKQGLKETENEMQSDKNSKNDCT